MSAYDVFAGGDPNALPLADYSSSFATELDRYVQLPGGVVFSVRSLSNIGSTTNVYSLPDLQGNVLKLVSSSGSSSGGPYIYDPNGNSLTSTAPNNSDSSAYYYGWKGQSQVSTDSNTRDDLMQMGSRLYIPSLGRFAQPDPVENGNADAYVYPLDPIDDADLTGQCYSKLNWLCGRLIQANNTAKKISQNKIVKRAVSIDSHLNAEYIIGNPATHAVAKGCLTGVLGYIGLAGASFLATGQPEVSAAEAYYGCGIGAETYYLNYRYPGSGDGIENGYREVELYNGIQG